MVTNLCFQLEERRVDKSGRAYSPAMASQYSPPQLPVDLDGKALHLPPLTDGSMSLFWMPVPASVKSEDSEVSSSALFELGSRKVEADTLRSCTLYVQEENLGQAR